MILKSRMAKEKKTISRHQENTITIAVVTAMTAPVTTCSTNKRRRNRRVTIRYILTRRCWRDCRRFFFCAPRIFFDFWRLFAVMAFASFHFFLRAIALVSEITEMTCPQPISDPSEIRIRSRSTTAAIWNMTWRIEAHCVRLFMETWARTTSMSQFSSRVWAIRKRNK